MVQILAPFAIEFLKYTSSIFQKLCIIALIQLNSELFANTTSQLSYVQVLGQNYTLRMHIMYSYIANKGPQAPLPHLKMAQLLVLSSVNNISTCYRGGIILAFICIFSLTIYYRIKLSI